jgi:hypothetical protein
MCFGKLQQSAFADEYIHFLPFIWVDQNCGHGMEWAVLRRMSSNQSFSISRR